MCPYNNILLFKHIEKEETDYRLHALLVTRISGFIPSSFEEVATL